MISKFPNIFYLSDFKWGKLFFMYEKKDVSHLYHY
jgi:hypothetical protein